MGTLRNEISIEAPLEKIWATLTNLEMLDKYDPTVKKSTLLPGTTSGIGSGRKVDMLDGKNWFEEKVTVFQTHQALVFDLTACSFPIHQLRHSYSFEHTSNRTSVKQVMEYTVKFGWLGKLLDVLMIRRQTDSGVKKFLAGLKTYTETH